MGTLGTCCCGCCLEPADMPYTAVQLVAPLDDCEGGLGDGLGGAGQGIGGGGNPETPTYPEASFSQANCCYLATFNLACQDYTEHCGLWASQTLDFSYKAEFYKLRPTYLEEPGEPDCQCTLVQTKLVDYASTQKNIWLARYRLKAIQIHVGKISVQCDGDESPACKFYIAASYIFEICEYTTGWFYPEYTIDYTATGNYRPGNCSVTNTWQEASTINDCTDLLATDPWNVCNQLDTKVISRIKLFDTLPTGQISITNADLPPIGCCGGETGCEVFGQPCGLELVDNCIGNLPAYNGAAPNLFCQRESVSPGPPPYADGCEILIGCPEVLEKTAFDATCDKFVLDEVTGCYERVDQTIINVPGNDDFTCGYCDSETGERTIYYADMYGTFGSEPVPGLCTTGECCFNEESPETQYNCPEFVDTTDSAFAEEEFCRIDITDYTCTVGSLTTHTTGAFCFNLPTVTIELI